MMVRAKPKNPSGNSRAAQNLKIRQDALRKELASRNYISQLQKIADRFDPEAKDAYDRDDVPMVKERVSILFKMLDKTLPNLRPVDLPVALPFKTSIADQASSILRAAAAGKITPSEAATLMQSVSNQAKIIETDELERRVSRLEEKVAPLDATPWRTTIVHPPAGLTAAEQIAFAESHKAEDHEWLIFVISPDVSGKP